METYHILEPEVGGAIGQTTVLDSSVDPPLVQSLEYAFETWLGDDILEAHPCFIVTLPLRSALESFAGSGYSFDTVTISKAEQFDDMNPNTHLPDFAWFKIHGKAGMDDCGLSKDGSLVVSSRMLEVLRSFNIAHCLIRRRPYNQHPCRK